VGNNAIEAKIPTVEEMRRLQQQAQSGDKSALPELREILRQKALVAVLGGDLADNFRRNLIRDHAGNDLILREAVIRKVAEMRNELAGPECSPVESLLADRIVTCWLVLHDREIRYAQTREFTLQQAEFHQHYIERAHHRYLSAIRTLAAVRKLALPVLQVNIARKQVNVAGTCAAPAAIGKADAK
jgi:hypothetical protein